MKYDLTTSKWYNASLSSGESTLSALTDCTITSPIEGNLLVYSSASSKWINADTIPDNILFVKDDVDGTKKNYNFNYQVLQQEQQKYWQFQMHLVLL